MWEPQRAMLDEALAKDDPELYVAYALIIGVRNREETKKLNDEDLERLRKLDKDESIEIPDAFAEAKRRVAKQKEMAGPDDVVGDSLKLLWQKVREQEAKDPESVSLRTLRTLQQMNDAEAAICLEASKQLLDRGGYAWERPLASVKPDLMFFCLNDTHVVKVYERGHYPDDPANMYDHLEECGLVYRTPFTYEVDNIHGNYLFATVGDKLGLRIEPIKDMDNIFNRMLADKNPQFYKCYNLTRAGQELFSCLELKTDRAFFLDLCRNLKEMFKDFVFTVYSYERTETDIVMEEISLEKEETPTE